MLLLGTKSMFSNGEGGKYVNVCLQPVSDTLSKMTTLFPLPVCPFSFYWSDSSGVVAEASPQEVFGVSLRIEVIPPHQVQLCGR